MNPIIIGAIIAISAQLKDNRKAIDAGVRAFISDHEDAVSTAIDVLDGVGDVVEDIDLRNPATIGAVALHHAKEWLIRRMPGRVLVKENKPTTSAIMGDFSRRVITRLTHDRVEAGGVWIANYEESVSVAPSAFADTAHAHAFPSREPPPLWLKDIARDFSLPEVLQLRLDATHLVYADPAGQFLIIQSEEADGVSFIMARVPYAYLETPQDKLDPKYGVRNVPGIKLLPWLSPCLGAIAMYSGSLGGDSPSAIRCHTRFVPHRRLKDEDYAELPSHKTVYDEWDARLAADARFVCLVQGPPGGGKTSGVLRYLQSRNRPYIYISASTASDDLGAIYMSDRDIILDDVDRISSGRFLEIFNTMDTTGNTLWITSNNLRKIPEALRRPGRIDQVLLWPTISDADIAVLTNKYTAYASTADFNEGREYHLAKLRAVSALTGLAGARSYLTLLNARGPTYRLLECDITYTQPPSLDADEVYKPDSKDHEKS